jgi:hypothetical protein
MGSREQLTMRVVLSLDSYSSAFEIRVRRTGNEIKKFSIVVFTKSTAVLVLIAEM